MRSYCVLILLALASTQISSVGAEEGKRPTTYDRPMPSMELFSTLSLTEFRLPALDEQSPKSAKEIVALFEKHQESNELELVRSIRIAAVENTEGRIRIGTPGPDGTTQYTEAQFRFAQRDDRIICDLSYQVVHGVERGDRGKGTPEVVAEFMSTIVLEYGKPTFVGGAFGGDGSFLIATLEE